MSPALAFVLAVLATTYAGPVLRFARAPALAIAFWRLALALPVTGAVALIKERADRVAPAPQPPVRSAFTLMGASGVLLGLHLWACRR